MRVENEPFIKFWGTRLMTFNLIPISDLTIVKKTARRNFKSPRRALYWLVDSQRHISSVALNIGDHTFEGVAASAWFLILFGSLTISLRVMFRTARLPALHSISHRQEVLTT
jgi:hypothetical protein